MACNLGLQGGNSGLAEGGYLSTVCLMAIPMALFLGKHGQLIPRLPLMNIAVLWGRGLLALVTAIGTYERSALVGLVAAGRLHVHSLAPQVYIRHFRQCHRSRHRRRDGEQLERPGLDHFGLQLLKAPP